MVVCYSPLAEHWWLKPGAFSPLAEHWWLKLGAMGSIPSD